MATELERLSVLIEANTKSYERAMVKLGQKTQKTTNGARKNFRQLDRSMKKSGGIAKSFAGGFLIGFAATLLTRFVNPIKGATEALEEFDALGKRIRTSGFSSDLFQTLQFAALEESVDESKFNKGIEKFVVNLAEVKTGLGEMTSSLKDSHPALIKELQAARNVDEAIVSLSKAVSSAQTAEEKALITKAAFGARLLGMVRVLDRGAEGLEKTKEKAAELGLIIDEKLLKSAEDLENKFGVASKVISINFQQAVINLAPFIVSTTEAISNMARGVSGLIDRLRKFASGVSGLNTPMGSFVNPRTGPTFSTDLSDLALDQDKGPELPVFAPQTAKQNAAIAKAAKAGADSALQAYKDSFAMIEQIGSNVASNLSSAFQQFAETGKISFKDMARSMLLDLNKLLLNKAFTMLINSAIGGFTGTVQTGSGLRIPSFTTSVSAPGRAAGGMVNPRRAFRVGERGPETFVPTSAGRIQPAGGGVEINVQTPAGFQGEAREREESGVRIVDVIFNTVNKGMSDGKFDAAMGARFGARSQTARR